TDTEVNSSAQATSSITVTVDEQADAPNLAVADATISVNEGGAVALNISSAAAEGDQNAPSITIDGLGDATLTNTAGDTLTITDGSITLTAGQLDGLTLHAGPEAAGPYNLSITAPDTEVNSSAQATSSITVTVDEQADAPNLAVADATISV